jgi:hypothetical protein
MLDFIFYLYLLSLKTMFVFLFFKLIYVNLKKKLHVELDTLLREWNLSKKNQNTSCRLLYVI